MNENNTIAHITLQTRVGVGGGGGSDQMDFHMQRVDVFRNRRGVLERDHRSDCPSIQAHWDTSGLAKRGLTPTRQPQHGTQIPENDEEAQR